MITFIHNLDNEHLKLLVAFTCVSILTFVYATLLASWCKCLYKWFSRLCTFIVIIAILSKTSFANEYTPKIKELIINLIAKLYAQYLQYK